MNMMAIWDVLYFYWTPQNFWINVLGNITLFILHHPTGLKMVRAGDNLKAFPIGKLKGHFCYAIVCHHRCV